MTLTQQNLRATRVRFGLTQEKLAELSGISRPVVVRIEKGNGYNSRSFQKIESVLVRLECATEERQK